MTGRFILVASAVALALATLTPSGSDSGREGLCLICGEYGGVDVVLNFVLFLPFGVGLAMCRVRDTVAAAVILASTVGIELLQFDVVDGRYASLGDLLFNTLGGIAGFVAARHSGSLVRPQREFARKLAAIGLGFWLAAMSISAYSLVPAMPEPPYYLHVARKLGSDSIELPGKVLSAHLGPEPLDRWNLPNAGRLKTLLEQPAGTPVRVIMVSTGVPRGTAEIMSASQADAGTILYLGQQRQSVVFSVRTGADALRLRPYAFRLDTVFAESDRSQRDSVSLAAQFGLQRIVMTAEDGRRRLRREFVPRLSQAWRLAAPGQTYIDGALAESLASALFLATLIMPGAYWTFLARRGPDGSRTHASVAWPLAALAIALILGLAAIPMAFRLPPAAAWELLATAIGAALAAALAGIMAGRSAPRDYR